MKIKCGAGLHKMIRAVVDDVVPCGCGCDRVYLLQERTRRLTYWPWPRTRPAADAVQIWVRQPRAATARLLVYRERAW